MSEKLKNILTTTVIATLIFGLISYYVLGDDNVAFRMLVYAVTMAGLWYLIATKTNWMK
jgi:hypothetical protein